MKIKNKGKVYPSPSPSSSSSSTSSGASISSVALNNKDADGGGDGNVLSVLNLLPAAILALVSFLSLEDREVLAYLITRSIKTTTTTTTPTSSSFIQDTKKKPSKKPSNKTYRGNHEAPIFDCDCFDCYRSYWFRWDSSPNRELIHQAIEAFEDHLTNGEQSSRKSTRAKKRDKTGRRLNERPVTDVLDRSKELVLDTPPPETNESPHSPPALTVAVASPNDDAVSPASTPDNSADGGQEEAVMMTEAIGAVEEETVVVARTHMEVSSRKGLARKVLPDVLGLLNSRLWSLWSPNV